MSSEGSKMEEACFKSILSAQDSCVFDDTSLALPLEEHITSPTNVHSNNRSVRVQQQVQLTLARKIKKTTSNGDSRRFKGTIPLQKNITRSPDTSERAAPNPKVNEIGFGDQSLIRRPSRRIEVSPLPSPELLRPSYGALCFGTYTVPGPSHPLRMGPLLEHSFGADSFRRYAFSEVPQGTSQQVSTYGARASTRHAGYRNRRTPSKQPAETQALGTDGTFQHRCPNSSYFSNQQINVNRETHAGWRQAGYRTLGASRHTQGPAWTSQGRSEAQRFGRQNSYPYSVASMEVDMTGKMEAELPVQQVQMRNNTSLKSESKAAELTLEKAVNLLSHDNEDMLVYATVFIQNQCFSSSDARKMVFYLHGLPKLLNLLESNCEEVQRLAAGALRNMVFQSNENKMEVKENEGLLTVLRVLRSSRDIETRRQLAGLLWNLSSHDLLKEHLCKDALPVLTSNVLVPCSGISEGENPKDELLADPDTFHSATGCLRNVSSAGPEGRKAMRECDNLIDSLVYYIRGTIADYKSDDKSTENCVCILHNLSYQIEAEIPMHYARELYESQQNLAPKTKTPGCFGYGSGKLTKAQDQQCPLLEEKANPCGVEWLWSAITVRMYLSLMARSTRQCTQEAALGALQNITAGNGMVTEAIAHTIVQRENGLQQVRKMLQEGEKDVKKTAVSLVKNLSRYKGLHPDIVKQVLPELVGMLPNADQSTGLSSEVTASLCHTLLNLSQNDTQNVKAIVNHGALPKIISLSNKDNGYGPTRTSQAARILLHSMWNHTNLHGAYRKAGYRKTDFINARTTK